MAVTPAYISAATTSVCDDPSRRQLRSFCTTDYIIPRTKVNFSETAFLPRDAMLARY